MVHFKSEKRIFFSVKAILKLECILVAFTEHNISEKISVYKDKSGGMK